MDDFGKGFITFIIMWTMCIPMILFPSFYSAIIICTIIFVIIMLVLIECQYSSCPGRYFHKWKYDLNSKTHVAGAKTCTGCHIHLIYNTEEHDNCEDTWTEHHWRRRSCKEYEKYIKHKKKWIKEDNMKDIKEAGDKRMNHNKQNFPGYNCSHHNLEEIPLDPIPQPKEKSLRSN